jgi:hypothetical protein
MQDSGVASGIAQLIDIPARKAYGRLVTKDTSMIGSDEMYSKEVDSKQEQSTTPVFDRENPGHGQPLSAYSQARFIEAVRGVIPLADYVQEVSAHVEKQLPSHRGFGPRSTHS